MASALSLADQQQLHKLCFKNRELFVGVARAGCFYCCEIFAPDEIMDWVDGDQVNTGGTQDGMTALCPRCGIDSVIPETRGVSLCVALLQEMRAHWF